MSLRQKINQNPAIAIALVAILVACAGWYLVRGSRGDAVQLPTQFYFTTDDGKTTFAAGFDQLPPFQHQGKEAVRARVFSPDGGNTKVTYLEKFTPDYRTKVEAALKDPSWKMSAGVLPSPGIPAFSTLVKKPGDANWYPIASSQGSAIAGMKGQPGSPDSYVEVFPE